MSKESKEVRQVKVEHVGEEAEKWSRDLQQLRSPGHSVALNGWPVHSATKPSHRNAPTLGR